VHVDRVATALLIVERVVLDIAEHVLRLQAFHDLPNHLAGQQGIFPQVFESAPVAGFAGEIDSSPEGHVVTLIAQFSADQSAILVGGIEIPTGGAGQVGGKGGGVAAIVSAVPDAVGGIGHLYGWNAQARNRNHVARATIRSYGQRTSRTEFLKAGSVEQGNFLGQGHLLDDQVSPLVGREVGVHPGHCGGRVFGRGLGRKRDG